MTSLFPPDAPRIEAGVHDDIPAERYHAAVGISNSMLKHLAKSPAHLRAYMQEKPETTPAMRLGTLIHTAVLEPDQMSRWTIRPENLDGRTKAGKEWMAEAEASGKEVVTHAEHQVIMGVQESIFAHPIAKIAMAGEPETSIFWKDEETGLLLKCRPDSLCVGNIIGDLKTTDDASKDGFARTIFNFRYYVQAAYYIDGCNAHDLKRECFFFVAVEKKPPYAVNCFQLDAQAIDWGRQVYRQELRLLADCIEKDEWPGYATPENRGYDIIELPRYAEYRLQEEIEK